MGSSGGQRTELKAGWKVLAGAMLGLAFGVQSLPFYTSGLFIAPLHEAFGWSRTELSLGVTLLVAALGIAAPVVGYLCDRFGERRLILPGLIIQIAALLALSQISTLVAFYCLMGGMALFGAGCASLPYVRIVNRNFDKAKGTALGALITGAAGLSALSPVLLQPIITDHGWRSGYIAIGIAVACATPLILLFLRADRAEGVTAGQAADLPPFSYRQLLADAKFHKLASAMFLVALACPGLIVHFAPMLADAGAEPGRAALMISLIGISQTVARLGTGMLVDRFFAPRVATLLFGLSAASFVAFLLGGVDYAIIGALAAGMAYGAESDLVGYFIGRYYPREQFGRIFGIFYSVFLAGTALSPVLYGAMVDRFGSYDPALAVTVFLLSASAAIFTLLPRFPAPARVD